MISNHLSIKTTGDFMIKRLLFTCVALLFFVSVPHEASAAPKKETKKERRERLKREKAARERRQIKKKVIPQLNSGNPQKILQAIVANVQNSKELSAVYKQLICSCLINLSKTPTGRYIFSNIPDNITIHTWENPNGIGVLGTYNHGHRKACFSDHYIRKALSAESELKKQEQLLRFTTVIAHELTHATQGHLQLGVCPGASYEDYATLKKFREMHAILEEQCAEVELLNLPAFAEVRKKREKTGELNVFLRRAQELQIKAGMSPSQARRFARTEFVRSFWSNTPNTPLQVGDEKLYPSAVGPSQVPSAPWNISYNSYSFGYARRLGSDYYTKTKGADIRRELNDTLKTIGLNLTVDLVIQKKSFNFEQGRLIGYVNGIKQLEIDSLGVNGRVFKRFEQGKMHSLTFQTTEKDGSYKDYFYDGRTLRATYTIKNGKLSGVYREYDRQGRQIIEAPVENGAGAGKGWVLENNKRVSKEFRGGLVLENGKLFRHPSYTTKSYWLKRYLEENKK